MVSIVYVVSVLTNIISVEFFLFFRSITQNTVFDNNYKIIRRLATTTSIIKRKEVFSKFYFIGSSENFNNSVATRK